MAKHTWNSTPPRLWPILRLAAERGWTISLDRIRPDQIRICLERGRHDPILTAEWTFHYDNAARTDIQFGRRHSGRWKFTTATVRSRADPRAVTANLRDLPRLILEAEHG